MCVTLSSSFYEGLYIILYYIMAGLGYFRGSTPPTRNYVRGSSRSLQLDHNAAAARRYYGLPLCHRRGGPRMQPPSSGGCALTIDHI